MLRLPLWFTWRERTCRIDWASGLRWLRWRAVLAENPIRPRAAENSVVLCYRTITDELIGRMREVGSTGIVEGVEQGAQEMRGLEATA